MLYCCLGNHHTNLRLYAKPFLSSVFSFHWYAFNIHIRLTPTQIDTFIIT